MAESYLGQEGAFYAERQPTDYIDWSKISSDLSKTLDAEAQRRTELKAFLDEENRLAINKLQESPQGEHKGANQFALEYADNGSKYLLMLNKMLKSGQMSVKDYTVAVQNIKDGTNDTFSMLKEYQANFKDIMDRAKNDDNQMLELYTSSQIEGYGDFNKSQIYIDPSSGRVSIAMKEKKIVDGKEVYVMTNNPNQIATVSSLRGQLKARYDKFNVDNATDLYVKSLGKEIEAVKAAGGYNNISDVTAKDDFYKAETDAIHAMLTNPLHNSSILTNSKKFTDDGKQYGFTYDKAEAERDPSKILLRLDPSSNVAMPDFESTANGRKQMEIATEWIRKQARTKYDKETKFQETTPRTPSAAQIERAGREKQDLNTAMSWNTLRWGNNEQKKRAAQIVLGSQGAKDMGLIDIDLNSKPGSVILKYADKGLNRTIEIPKEASDKAARDWAAEGNELHNLDEEKAVKAGGVLRKEYNPNVSGVRAFRSAAEQRETEKVEVDTFDKDIKDIDPEIFKNEQNVSTDKLNAVLNKYGVTAEPVGKGSFDEFRLSFMPPSGKKKITSPYTFSADEDDEGSSDTKKKIIRWLNINKDLILKAKKKAEGQIEETTEEGKVDYSNL